MTKIFLSYTAIIEGLTGLGLIFVPALVAHVLFGAESVDRLTIVLAMVGGAAICSIALLSWLTRLSTVAGNFPKVLLFYNIAVSAILLYACLKFGYHWIMLYVVIFFHLFQSAVGAFLLKK